MPTKPTKKPKVLRRKNIRRKKSATSQSKQIAALTTQVSKLNAVQYESVMLAWQRPKANIDTVTGTTGAYVLPIPITPNNPYAQHDALALNAQLKWSDNRLMSSAQYFQKMPVFGSSTSARNSSQWFHTGSTLKWRLQTNEPSFATYSVFLIQAKKRQADQLISDRKMKNSVTASWPGSAAQLEEQVDFITHQNVFGTHINKKYWKVLGHRVVNFSVPNVTDFKEVNADMQGGARGTRNTVLHEGTFRVPAGGSIRCFNKMPLVDESSPALGRIPALASTVGYLDEDTSKTCYLVIVNNGVSIDGETTELSTLTLDHYKAVV